MAGSEGPPKRVISEMDAIGRCKQCGAPYTEFNKVIGPTGRFCSDACREQHEEFTRRAQVMDTGRQANTPALFLLKRFVSKVIVVLILLAFVAFAAMVFDIPVLSDLVERVGVLRSIKEMLPEK
ncbi:MAG: hypothetical protein GY851_20090 [bacterium]|nr:hypothetical protein [bacterium]